MAWTEALTTLPAGHPPAHLLDDLRTHFSDKQISQLTLAICVINSWNRFAVGLGADVGSYKPGDFG